MKTLEPSSPPAPPHEARRVVVRTGADHYRTEILASGHELIADEPLDDGGTGLGPNSYGYLLSALGACTTITLRMYADRKGWPLEAITATLRHEKIDAASCEECVTQTGKVDRFQIDLEFTGPLTEDQRARLLAIAGKCPVHRTLVSENIVEIHLFK